MADEPDPGAVVTVKLAQMGVSFMTAMELPRIWVTGAQAIVQGDLTMLVLREQNIVVLEDGQPEALLKNVGSFIMPTQVARDIVKILGEQLAVLDQNGAG